MFQFEYLLKLKNRELQKEIETYRLLALAQRGQPKRRRSYCQMLFWIGTKLSGWGERLREKYPEAEGCVRSDGAEQLV
jgi:hypothetical protein